MESHIFAGPNNIGKSALLTALRRISRLNESCRPIIGSRDGAVTFGPSHGMRVPATDITEGESATKIFVEIRVDNARQLLEEEFPGVGDSGPFLTAIEITSGSPGKPPDIIMPKADVMRLVKLFDSTLAENNRPDGEHSNRVHIGLRAAKMIARAIVYVPHEREIVKALDDDPYANHEEQRFSGRNAIRLLTKWHLEGETARLAQVTRFLEAVITARVELRTSLSPALELRIDGGPWRDSSQLGAGLTQLVVIAISTQLVDNPILVIEEPEISLHPRLQRGLLEQLALCSEQVFLTTHSNHILDGERKGEAIYHLRPGNDETVVSAVPRNTVDLLRDLGVRPSSLSQANALLWVEGPSDAIYLRHFFRINYLCNKYVEGRDYSFAFHAGALLAHFAEARSDGAIVAFAEMNPNYFLVLDSDPDSEGQSTHAYTKPWIDHSRAWITAPKEIEGYISDSALQMVLDHSSTPIAPSDSMISLRRRLQNLGLPMSWAARKVELARKLVGLAESGISILNAIYLDDIDANLARIAALLDSARAADYMTGS